MESSLQIKGLLLDMDGLLLDTERVSLKCWEYAERETGYAMPEGFYPTLIGQTMRVIKVKLKQVVAPEFDLDAFIELANKRYHDAVDEKPVPVKTGARELLELLHERGIPVCLVTSTSRYLAERKLEQVNLGTYIPERVCGDEVENSKPSPDIYLQGARTLGFDPATLLALEDSENGLRSALSAGCKVAHVPDICPVTLDVQDQVDRIYRDLNEVIHAIYQEEIIILDS